jgi:hypothetical protein
LEITPAGQITSLNGSIMYKKLMRWIGICRGSRFVGTDSSLISEHALTDETTAAIMSKLASQFLLAAADANLCRIRALDVYARNSEIVRIDPTPLEQHMLQKTDMYRAHTAIKARHRHIVMDGGVAEILKNTIFVWGKTWEDAENFITEPARASFAECWMTRPTTISCVICAQDVVHHFSVTECGHVFCTRCVAMAVIGTNKCPMCRQITKSVMCLRLSAAVATTDVCQSSAIGETQTSVRSQAITSPNPCRRRSEDGGLIL